MDSQEMVAQVALALIRAGYDLNGIPKRAVDFVKQLDKEYSK